MRGKLLLAMAVLVALVGCTRIETGEIGLRKTFNGVYETTPLGPGYHQTIVGGVYTFSARETMLSLENMRPQTADKLSMKEVDVNFTYAVHATAIVDLYSRYNVSSHLQSGSEWLVMGNFVSALMTSAVNDEIAGYNAQDINTKRQSVVDGIYKRVEEKLKKEGLDDKISISQIVLKNAVIPDSLAESSALAANAQNAYTAKLIEVKTAQAEGQRIAALAAQSSPTYVALLNAQARMEMAKHCAATIVVPDNFTAIGRIQ